MMMTITFTYDVNDGSDDCNGDHDYDQILPGE